MRGPGRRFTRRRRKEASPGSARLASPRRAGAVAILSARYVHPEGRGGAGPGLLATFTGQVGWRRRIKRWRLCRADAPHQSGPKESTAGTAGGGSSNREAAEIESLRGQSAARLVASVVVVSAACSGGQQQYTSRPAFSVPGGAGRVPALQQGPPAARCGRAEGPRRGSAAAQGKVRRGTAEGVSRNFGAAACTTPRPALPPRVTPRETPSSATYAAAAGRGRPSPALPHDGAAPPCRVCAVLFCSGAIGSPAALLCLLS